ncbi:MAG TPA: GH3 auxin-responsive promoter family protein [Terriglobales bacterium]|nr:GH3 auxin-responsive promoter family protein [Terriglobales bacterium]
MMNNTTADQLRSRFRSANPEAAQREALLRRVIRPNETCEYGRAHGFPSIQSVRDFQGAVRICNYEGFRSYVDRMVRGEQGVLVSEPVRRFFITSGSTALPKYIPLNSGFIRDKWRAFQTYWSMVRGDHPEMVRGHLIANFSDGSQEQTAPGGALCGSESSFWNAFGGGDRTQQYPLPREILKISDAEARYYTIARVLLESNVSVLMTLNPSTIVRLLEVLATYGDLLEEDIKRGGLSAAMAVEPQIRQYVAARYRGSPLRAEQLRSVLSNKLPLANLWPDLQLAICWRSPMVRPYLDLLEQSLGAVPQRDYITMASEGIIAVPYEDGVSGGALAVETHFYEFIPAELADHQDPPTLLAHEIEAGKKYVVVLSTSGGLYRYNIGDVVQVRDFIGATPVIEFLHRTGHTCSLTGEKLTEDQVAHAIHGAASRLGLPLRAFTLCPIFKPFPHYALIAEVEDAPERELLIRFLMEMDRDLGCRNVEYHSKRSSHRLGAPEFYIVPAGSYAALQQRKVQAGVSDAQVKLSCLTRDPKWPAQFEIIDQVSCELAA